MDTIKWVQIACSSFLVMLPAAIEYRNWKYHDRRTKVHRCITAVLLTLWIFSAFGVSWAMYKDISRKEKLPAFTFYLNGLLLGKDTCITLPLTNEVTQLVFSVRNTGAFSADGVHVVMNFPGQHRALIRVVKSEGWNGMVSSFVSPDSVRPAEDQVFAIDYNNTIAQGEFFECPPLFVQSSNLVESLCHTWLTATARNGETFQISPSIHFKRDITKPHIGY